MTFDFTKLEILCLLDALRDRASNDAAHIDDRVYCTYLRRKIITALKQAADTSAVIDSDKEDKEVFNFAHYAEILNASISAGMGGALSAMRDAKTGFDARYWQGYADACGASLDAIEAALPRGDSDE